MLLTGFQSFMKKATNLGHPVKGNERYPRYLLDGVSNSTENSKFQNQLVKSVLKGWIESQHLYIFTSSPSSYQYQTWDWPDFLSVNAFLIPNFHALCLETLAPFPFSKMQKSGISCFIHIFPLTLTHGVVSSMT